MKIGLVIQNAEPARGGAERYTLALAADLVARGHEVHLLAQRFARNVEPARQVRLNGAAGTRTRRYDLLLRSLARHLMHTQYDVVHAMLPVWRCDIYHPHAGIEAENIATGHLKHHAPLRRLLSRVGNAINRRRQQFAAVEEALICGRQPPLVLCLSDYVRRTAMKHYARRSEHLAVLHNGVDLLKFDPAQRPQRRQQLRHELRLHADCAAALIVANDFERKGLGTAIRALSMLSPEQQKRTHLVVVGRQAPDRYRSLASRCGVASSVTFAGPTDDPAAFYQACDFFILPTHHDPCSLVAVEAVAMGLPVLTTRANGAGELLKPGVHGHVFSDADDPAPFSSAWAALLDAGTLAEARAACIELRPALSQVAHVDHLLKHYERIARRKNGE